MKRMLVRIILDWGHPQPLQESWRNCAIVQQKDKKQEQETKLQQSKTKYHQ
jgi:hypothetical protein